VSIEIIKVIKDTEDKAELIKKEANYKSKQIISNANANRLQILDEAQKKAESKTSSVLKEAKASAQLLYDEIISNAAQECEQLLEKASNNMDKAASIILERIVKAGVNS
jgi:V/A-type H+/Na+-transporting ATPase subunit G/H